MVSVYPIPPPDQGFSRFYADGVGRDPMNLPGIDYEGKLMDVLPAGNVLGVDDPSKKIRKPYTITKSREIWTEQEHDKFVEALHLFDRDWKKIEAFVGSKSVIQIRSHAQKYFLKVQKNGMSEHVPPPRPKRKAAHPYPHKAPKNVVSQATGSLQSSAALLESGYAATTDSSVSRNQIVGSPLPWTCNFAPPGCLIHVPQENVGLVSVTNNYSSSSNESSSHIWAFNKPRHKAKARRCNTRGAMPDFAQVYSFIGSVFDPAASDHMQKLHKMDPINVETVVVLMKNLAANLLSPEFEKHRKLLSSYNPRSIENYNSMGKAAAIPSCLAEVSV